MYRALKSFTGLATMRRGEVKEIKNEVLVKDLLKAGYIELVEDVKPEPSKAEAKAETEPAKRGHKPKAKKEA